MQGGMAQRLAGVGGLILFLVVANAVSYFMNCGVYFY